MPQPQNSGFNTAILLYAACCAVAAFAGWPWIKANFSPDMTPYTESGPYRGSNRNHASTGNRQMRAPGVRLDPDVPPGQVEDRRPGRGNLSRDLGGGDIGRLSPPPQAQLPRPYTDGRDVGVPRPREADGAPHYGRRQVKECSTPWWSTGPLQCGSWQEEGR
jgi:hypothetical protein